MTVANARDVVARAAAKALRRPDRVERLVGHARRVLALFRSAGSASGLEAAAREMGFRFKRETYSNPGTIRVPMKDLGTDAPFITVQWSGRRRVVATFPYFFQLEYTWSTDEAVLKTATMEADPLADAVARGIPLSAPVVHMDIV